MAWTRPDFIEITLGMEATAYVNTDDKLVVRRPLAVDKEVAEERQGQRTTDE
jgi:coenzyme PQQ precursor peptide PqqA